MASARNRSRRQARTAPFRDPKPLILVVRLKQLVPQYDKHISFGTYERGYSEAVKRARRMDEEAEDASERHRNPTTGVYQLTELICGS